MRLLLRDEHGLVADASQTYLLELNNIIPAANLRLVTTHQRGRRGETMRKRRGSGAHQCSLMTSPGARFSQVEKSEVQGARCKATTAGEEP